MELINRIKNWLKPTPSILAEVLSTEATREEMLGMRMVTPPSQAQILDDANRIVNYSSKTDYRVWSREAWAKALSHMDALQNPKATTDEIHFHRGALNATLNLLRISHQARAVKTQLESEETASSAR